MVIELNVAQIVYAIAWAWGQLRINFTRIFKLFTKLPESRGDEGNLENFENTRGVAICTQIRNCVPENNNKKNK